MQISCHQGSEAEGYAYGITLFLCYHGIIYGGHLPPAISRHRRRHYKIAYAST